MPPVTVRVNAAYSEAADKYFWLREPEDVRRHVDREHRDFGDTHGYYQKVPTEMRTLADLGVIDRIRCWDGDASVHE